MATIKKLIKEEGFVLGREIKKATDEFVSPDGKVIPARPTRYVVHVVTSSIVDEDGMQYMSNVDFEVDIETYKQCTYLRKVDGLFEFIAGNNGGVNKPVSLILKK